MPAEPLPLRLETSRDLLDSVYTLRDSVAADGRAIFRDWRPYVHRPDAAASLLNLAHYLAFRHRDLRPLQEQLMRFGLSSLGRLEGRVLATLDAVEGALEGIVGDVLPPAIWPPEERRFGRGQRRLRANTFTLFGPQREGRATRILVTLPTEAAEDPSYIRSLVECGADAVRINCAHDTPEAWAAMASHARAAGEATGRRITVLMDVAGPKMRTGEVRRPDDGKRLHSGDRFLLVADDQALRAPGEIGFRAVCRVPEILARLEPGASMAMDDGKLSGRIASRQPDGSLLIEVLRTSAKGFKLRPEKGLNFPGADLGLPPLGPKDLADLDAVAEHADLVGYSFVQSGADIAVLQEALDARRGGRPPLGIVAKIETVRAVRNLPEIIVRAAGRQPFGVMIARGDLAVEIGFARLAEMQEEILWICEAASVPVIWATQVLEEMVKSGLPTRGEMTDAATAARAECVMLNKGPQVADAIGVLDGLLRRMAEHQTKKTPELRALRSW